MFWQDPRVLFFSVHRFDSGLFYPSGGAGSHSMFGEGPGLGYNVNVPWNHAGVGDADYFAVWDHILIPIAKDFKPDMILISGGFDAAGGDPLGECCITPYGYSVMMKKLMEFANGRIMIALEGGYDLEALAISVLACVETLLEDKPIVGSSKAYPSESTWSIIEEVRQELSTFWPMLTGKLPKDLILTKNKTSPVEGVAESGVYFNLEFFKENFLAGNWELLLTYVSKFTTLEKCPVIFTRLLHLKHRDAVRKFDEDLFKEIFKDIVLSKNQQVIQETNLHHRYNEEDGMEPLIRMINENKEEFPPLPVSLLSEPGANLKKKGRDSNGDGFSKETKSFKVGVSATGPDKVSSAGVTATGSPVVLRPRKQIPTFRKVDLSENDCMKIVGRRIKVYWPKSRRWFVGCVSSFNSKNKLHTVFYDDGDKESLDLKTERFELEVYPDDGFTLVSELVSKLKEKEIRSNGGDVCKETEEEVKLSPPEAANGR